MKTSHTHTLQHYESFPHFPFFSPPLFSEQLPQSFSLLADAVSHQRHNFLCSFFPLKASCIETEVKCLWLICEKWYLQQINQWKGWKGETGSGEKKETTAHNLPSAISSSGYHYCSFVSSTNIVILSVCLSVCYHSPSLLHSLCLS